MDTSNPVVQLCVAGMQAESEGRSDAARDLFWLAWLARRDDFDACIAAHYVARHQDNPEETFHWNQEALNRADAVGDDRVRDFYPSLYLNMGRSHEDCGDLTKAKRYYALAAAQIDALPPGPYRDMVQGGITEGHGRTSAES
jgi:hypothetical protein